MNDKISTVEIDQFELLLESNPEQAIKFAIRLSDNVANMQIKAKAYVDGGSSLDSEEYIQKGIDLFTKLYRKKKRPYGTLYNLANGYSCLALSKRKYFVNERAYLWHLETITERLTAKYHYSMAVSEDDDNCIQAQCKTNMANILLSSYRWVEAYDDYRKAIRIDKKNGVAIAGALKIIFMKGNEYLATKEFVEDEMPFLFEELQLHEEYTVRQCGRKAYDEMIEEFTRRGIEQIKKNTSIITPDLTEYEKFIIKHNLSLNPFVSICGYDRSKADSLQIKEFISDFRVDSSIPETRPARN